MSFNKFKNIPILPPYLEELYINNNQIIKIDNLPNTLKKLYINYNNITSIDKNDLPPNLEYLDCADNQIMSISSLPPNLKHLDCAVNKLKELPKLPRNLKELYCSYNKIKNIPTFPESLINIGFLKNNIILPEYLSSELKQFSYLDYDYINEKATEFTKLITIIRHKKRMLTIRQELISKVFHPSRVEKWVEFYGTDYDDYI